MFVLLQQFVQGLVAHGLEFVSGLAYVMTSVKRERMLSEEAATFWLVIVIFFVMMVEEIDKIVMT
jgi:hypothetical protein